MAISKHYSPHEPRKIEANLETLGYVQGDRDKGHLPFAEAQGQPTFVALGERLERLKERHEQGQLHSIQFLKELLTLAREVVEAEQHVDPVDEQARAKAALTELFAETRNGETPAVVDRIVADIDGIVRGVRFPGWQGTKAGERDVQKALRRVVYVKYQIKDQGLFDRAFGYIQQYY
jgi:type I restriction enzyme, R subunit